MVQGARANSIIKLNTTFMTEAYIPLLSSSVSHHKYLTNTHMQFVKNVEFFMLNLLLYKKNQWW